MPRKAYIIGLGLDDSLEPRKISQGMVGQVSRNAGIIILLAQSKKVSGYHSKHDQGR
ncbi:MAG: RuvB-like domain-containing protein [Flammeovirgaceae bacterium]